MDNVSKFSSDTIIFKMAKTRVNYEGLWKELLH